MDSDSKPGRVEQLTSLPPRAPDHRQQPTKMPSLTCRRKPRAVVVSGCGGRARGPAIDVLDQILGGFGAGHDVEEVRGRIALKWTGPSRVTIAAAFGADQVAA